MYEELSMKQPMTNRSTPLPLYFPHTSMILWDAICFCDGNQENSREKITDETRKIKTILKKNTVAIAQSSNHWNLHGIGLCAFASLVSTITVVQSSRAPYFHILCHFHLIQSCRKSVLLFHFMPDFVRYLALHLHPKHSDVVDQRYKLTDWTVRTEIFSATISFRKRI